MHPARLVLFALLTATALSAQNADTQPDGFTILQQMSDHYAKASDWYIQATEEQTTTTDYSRQWAKTILIGAASGNRYHYEGRSEFGSALHISDGKTAWDLRLNEHEYTQAPAPANGYQQPKGWPINDQTAQQAIYLKKKFAGFSKHYNSATRLPDEVISLNGSEIPSYVVQVTQAQRKGQQSAETSRDETLWIDKATWTVRKTVEHTNTFLFSGSAQVPLVEDTVTTYETAQLNSPVPETLFHFEPPPRCEADRKVQR
ncbi:hypothetical protein H7849_06570 [Alloacidobacterium dinghuense]|uniref:Outer membrane lipoprotein-sorting protein n=1 Tax=Alloacidobacterium dinghuense TaxID=2763107 RepID=A0A7G8BM28_9BACT|nr:hypothetical protein [Alloacidobacterium dinghuense]QNI33598.1 hypothetical protein H7849_06570 [Alloacidobacterium dinghuense]